MLWDNQGRKRIIALSNDYFGEKLKGAVSKPLSLLMEQELQLELDEDYTYMSFDERYFFKWPAIGGGIGAVGGAVIGKFGAGFALFSSPGIVPSVLILGAGGVILGLMTVAEEFNKPAGGRLEFNNINRPFRRSHEGEKSVDLHYASHLDSRSKRVKGTCRLSFDHILENETTWRTDYRVGACYHGDREVIAEGSFTINEDDMLRMFYQELLGEVEIN